MTVGGALFLIAIGAILKFAVSDSVSGVDLETIGVILMAVGGVGLVLGLMLMQRGPRQPRPGEPIDRY